MHALHEHRVIQGAVSLCQANWQSCLAERSLLIFWAVSLILDSRKSASELISLGFRL